MSIVTIISLAICVFSALGTVAVAIWSFWQGRDHSKPAAQTPNGESTELQSDGRFQIDDAA